MECSNIQEKLSVYIGDIISAEEKAFIDEHLKSCERCSESLSDLKKTIEYVKNLEEIEPPSWLTQKVMARVRTEAKQKRGIIQRLFYPLHIKLPIEVAATIAIAITTIYVFKTIQPEIKLETRTEIAKAPFKERKPVLAKPAEQPIPSKEPEALEGKKASEAPAPVIKQDKAISLTGAVGKEEAKREVMPAIPKAKAALVERKMESISLTLNVKDLETAGKEIEKTVKELEGKITKTESFENKNILLAELDSEKVIDLFEKLKQIGEFREKVVALENREGDIELKIEVVKDSIRPE
jgi:hypothetical protein